MRRLFSLVVHLFNRKKISQCGKGARIASLVIKRRKGASIHVGDNSLIEGKLVTETEISQLIIKDNVFIGGGTLLDCVCQIVIEQNVLISYGCVISDSDNHSLKYSDRRDDLSAWRRGFEHDWSNTNSEPILINKGAWVGAKSIILKGVTVGECAIIGAGSVVTKNVPAWTIVAGNPARVIRELREDER